MREKKKHENKNDLIFIHSIKSMHLSTTVQTHPLTVWLAFAGTQNQINILANSQNYPSNGQLTPERRGGKKLTNHKQNNFSEEKKT